jgi:hypothetical protein
LRAGEEIGGGGAHSGGFGAAAVERIGGESPALGFIVRAEPSSGERQQLGFEVRGDDFDVDAAEADTDMESGSAHRFDVVVRAVALLDGAACRETPKPALAGSAQPATGFPPGLRDWSRPPDQRSRCAMCRPHGRRVPAMLRVADLRHRQQVWIHAGGRGGECVNRGVVLLLSLRGRTRWAGRTTYLGSRSRSADHALRCCPDHQPGLVGVDNMRTADQTATLRRFSDSLNEDDERVDDG